ncbi:hypothetical protein BDV30DRAFT_160733 [Aspergillus minisclerotigenes]|uniref:Uncharacterized protein n=1 Tax=Aspergillus minisclerotigenes TaxID=656917 RepID=A0A5N6IXX7_9EURO|nr:hypothetical protein BDV30DRAFT_160733 [Aspergillus minisclerotigenes]
MMDRSTLCQPGFAPLCERLLCTATKDHQTQLLNAECTVSDSLTMPLTHTLAHTFHFLPNDPCRTMAFKSCDCVKVIEVTITALRSEYPVWHCTVHCMLFVLVPGNTSIMKSSPRKLWTENPRDQHKYTVISCVQHVLPLPIVPPVSVLKLRCIFH